MRSAQFLSFEQARKIADQFGTPVYVYDEASLMEAAERLLAFPNPFGLTPRYAMKACSNGALLNLFHEKGIHFDASSGFEVLRAIQVGIPADRISLSSQEFPEDIFGLVDLGISVNACSLSQLKAFGQALPGAELGLRVNPGVGSGGTLKTNVGGPSSSFGIWHEVLDEAEAIIQEFSLKVVRIHSHIGSGSDPNVWIKAAELTINQVRRFPAVTHINLGGGFKVGRMPVESSTDLQVVGALIKVALQAFADETGRQLRLEVEPGTFLVANSGCLLGTVQDKVHTGDSGHVFLKLDAGMTDILRPTLYAAQQPMTVVPASDQAPFSQESVIVVGHCCESGDLLTPDESDPGLLKERSLQKAEIGDLFIIDGAGAYCSSMNTKNYNSFPELPEVLVRSTGESVLIRKQQTLEQILQNEIPLA